MAKTPRQQDEPTRSRRVRAALAPLGRASAATTACILWVGLALPGLAASAGLRRLRRPEHRDLTPERAARDRQRLRVDARGARGDARTRACGDQPPPGPQFALRRRGDTRGRTRRERARRRGRHDARRRPTRAIVRAPGPGPTSAGADAPVDVAAAATSAAIRSSRAEPQPQPAAARPPRRSRRRLRAKSAQSITFTTSPGAAVVGGSYSVGASASSGLPVSFSLAPASSAVCTISGATVAFVGTGTCTIRANQAGNASYLPAPQVDTVRRRRRRDRAPDDQLQLRSSVGRPRRRPRLPREREGDLGAAGRVRRRRARVPGSAR